MGRADVEPSRKEEMDNRELPAPFLQGKVHTYLIQYSLCRTILFASWSRRLCLL